jgi:hypothetical protein
MSLINPVSGVIRTLDGAAVRQISQLETVDGATFPWLHEFHVFHLVGNAIDQNLAILVYV